MGTYKKRPPTYYTHHISLYTFVRRSLREPFTAQARRRHPHWKPFASRRHFGSRLERARLAAASARRTEREREDGRTLHEVAALHLNLLQLGSELDGSLGEARRRIHINVLDADAVDSVALVGRRLVLSVKDVAQVRAAAVADNLEALHVSLDADVALVAGVVAILERVPTAVLELGGGGIKRVLARAARKVALLREEGVVLAGARSLSAGLAKALELLLR